jgi:F-type H+-transporting ATPase subunit beta
MTGHYVTLEDSIESFAGLLMGNYDQVPEMAVYMVGGIDTVLDKAKKMAEEAADLEKSRRAKAAKAAATA